MHAEALDFVRRSVAGLIPTNIVEIGSYNVNGSVRMLFPNMPHYVGVDIRPGPGVDVVADGAMWRPDGWQPDLVLCCEVLEHVHPAVQRAIVENAWGMLAEEGTLVLTMAAEPRKPHTWDGHLRGTPGVDYWNVNPIEIGDGFYKNGLTSRQEYYEDRGDFYLASRKPLVMAYA